MLRAKEYILSGLSTNYYQEYPLFPAMKAAVAAITGDWEWCRPRPPLSALDDDSYEQLYQALIQTGLEMGEA